MDDNTLPKDILIIILVNYLTQRQMVTAKRVCKLWHTIIKENVELLMPSNLTVYTVLENALHIYLGSRRFRNVQNVPLNDNEDIYYWNICACKSGDRDLVFRWLKRCVMKPFYTSWGLYYCGHPEWLQELGIEESLEGAVMGSAEGGRIASFYDKCNEGIHKEIKWFGERIEAGLKLAIIRGHYRIVSVIKDQGIVGDDVLSKCCLVPALETKNDELIKKVIEEMALTPWAAICSVANVPGIIPDITKGLLQSLDYLVRMEGFATKQDLVKACEFSMREGRREIVMKRLKELE